MGRSASPVQPGSTPETPAPDAFTANVTLLGDDEAAQVGEALTDAALQTEVAKSENAELAALVAQQAAMLKAMGEQMQRLEANQRTVAKVAPEPVKLPTMAEALKNGKPTVPVLTEEGWYVPPVLSAAPQKA